MKTKDQILRKIIQLNKTVPKSYSHYWELTWAVGMLKWVLK